MSCFSIVGTYFTEEKTKYFGYIEASVGLGLIIGPLLGSVMYGYFNY